ncbi:hypothetical protein ACIRP2_01515 [Streptomyces sp. NPDC101194]|uniref:hypothetical protein n=1 Tax=Streptomyces sp. NPDC101194 TaxID=3366127 RepID=UPI00382F9CCD
MHIRILLTAVLFTAVIQPSPTPSASASAVGTPSADAMRPGASPTTAKTPQGSATASRRAKPPSTRALAQPSLTISVPTTANLGGASVGSTRSAQLGTVTVTGSEVPQWDVTVTATALTTAGGSIATGNIAYWSGPATADTGNDACHPGQTTAAEQVTLDAARTAFSHSGATATESCSWNPTLVITVPATAVVGQYTGTITHSVA